MSQEREFLARIAWAGFFTVGLVACALLFKAWGVLPFVLAFVLYFTLTKKA
jgi:hypothetical protein